MIEESLKEILIGIIDDMDPIGKSRLISENGFTIELRESGSKERILNIMSSNMTGLSIIKSKRLFKTKYQFKHYVLGRLYEELELSKDLISIIEVIDNSLDVSGTIDILIYKPTTKNVYLSSAQSKEEVYRLLESNATEIELAFVSSRREANILMLDLWRKGNSVLIREVGRKFRLYRDYNSGTGIFYHKKAKIKARPAANIKVSDCYRLAEVLGLVYETEDTVPDFEMTSLVELSSALGFNLMREAEVILLQYHSLKEEI